MVKKVADKQTKQLLNADSDEAKKANTTQAWMGRILIADPAKSVLAKKMNITEKGEYAIKIR